jgi:hypothetical protein
VVGQQLQRHHVQDGAERAVVLGQADHVNAGLGLDVGPMTGLDTTKVDAAFFADGSVRSLEETIDMDTFRRLSTSNDGQPVAAD